MMPKIKRRTEATRDGTSADDEEELPDAAADEEAAAAAPAAKKARKGKAPAARAAEQSYENGVLRSVVLEHFMNHEHLRIDLDPHVNFIVGKNGSGKSAIVNSLIAGLGHRASATGRATNSSKSLIMHGKESALIQMHFANGGEDPFKPGEFGATIVAEHRLERSGGGSYRLKDGPDDKGRKSSQKEFAEMCAHLNIQASNPCALLTQEHAKKFLHHGNSESRYHFFLQAANLESRKADLNDTMENVELLKKRLGRAEEGMAEKRELATRCQHEYEGAKKLKQLQQEMDAFEPLLGWAMVVEREAELEEQQSAARAAEEAEARAKADAEAVHSGQQDMEARVAELERTLKGVNEAVVSHSTKGQRLKEQAVGKQKELKRAKKHVAELGQSLELAEADAKSLADELEHQRQMVGSSTDSAQAEQVRRLDVVHQQIEADDAAIASLEAEASQLTQEHKAALDESRRAEAANKEAAEAAQTKESELQQAKKGAFDRVAALHPDMTQLLSLIRKQAAQFGSPPLGPLGAHLAVKSELSHLGPAAELAIGPPNLCAFIVTSSADETKLRELFKQLKPTRNMPSLLSFIRIAIRKPQPRFALSASRAPDAPVALIDALDITAKGAEADATFNYLLDHCNGENKMVFSSLEQAQSVVWQSEAARVESFVCRNYNEEGRRVFKRSRTTGSEHLPRCRRFLVADKQAMLQALADQAKAAKAEHGATTRAFKEADGARKAKAAAEKAARAKLPALQKRVAASRDEADQLSSESAQDAVLSSLEESRQAAQRAKREAEALRKQLDDAKGAVTHVENEFAPLKTKVEEGLTKYTELMERASEVEAELAEARAPLKKATLKISASRKVLAAAQKAQEEARATAAKLQKNLLQVVPQVEGMYGERVHDPKKRTVSQLQQEKRTLEARIRTQEAKHGGKNLTRLAEEAAAAKAHYESNQREIENVLATQKEAQAAFSERHKFFKKECKSKGKQAGQDFNMRLSRKGHSGSLLFDHDAETLALTVVRNNQDEHSATTSDARNLSGGERSFTTLAFELAMWEFCQTPFRVLDEFDVYMDDTYRKQAVDALMELCDQQQGRQFLFVTPQDMHPYLQGRHAAGKSMPRITKMKDVR